MSAKERGVRFSRRGFLVAAGGAFAGCVSRKRPAFDAAVPHLTFGLVTDLHSADLDPNAGRYYRDSAAKLAACIGDLHARRTDFLIELGDFKDLGPTADATLANLRAIEAVFTTYRGPRYHVLGNHDMDRIAKVQTLSAIENTGIPRNRAYYSFDAKGVHCVVLDAAYRPDGVPYSAGNFKWTESFIPADELAWLARDLRQTALPTIVFVHQLLDGDQDAYFVRNAAAVRGLLEQSGRVIAVFQGHYHEGRFSRVRGIPYYTLKAMVMGPGVANGAYAVADVFAGGRVSVTGFRGAESRDLTSV